MTVDDKLMERLESLSRLKLDPGQRRETARRLEVVMAYLDKLGELDTGGATLPDEGGVCPLREDVAVESFSREDMLAVASNTEDGFFTTPRVVG